MASIPPSYFLADNVDPVSALARADSDYRALVCVFLFGGADSHNMVVPLVGNPNRAPYDAVRGATAVAAGSALPLGSTGWGLHPNMPNMQARFAGGNLAVMMNVGPLKAPTNRASYFAGSAPLPEQLFSHNTQQLTWQAVPPASGLLLTSGWMGRAGEFAGRLYNPDPLNSLGANFSINGRVLQCDAFETIPSVMNTSGAVNFGSGDSKGINATTYANTRDAARTRSEWNNVIQSTFANRVRAAMLNQSALAANLATLGATPNGRFDAVASNSLAQQLRVVARIIQSRSSYNHRRDLFFVSIGGFDNHSDLNVNFPPLLTTIDVALNTFWLALGDIGMQERVVAFTESDFGRTMVINTTSGSDHGWGGHHLVLGGPVNAGVYGTVDLTVNGSMDAGQGRLIPTTSTEQYLGEMMRWWGVPSEQIPVVMENAPVFSPRTLPILREPNSAVGAPALHLDFMASYGNGGVLDPRVTFSRGGGPATQFDANGNLITAPTNLVCNSEMADAVPGVIGSGGVAPTNWSIVNSSGQGITTTILAVGTLPGGERYMDIRIAGTATANAVPYIRFGNPGVLNSMAEYAPSARMVGTVWAQLLSGSVAALGTYRGTVIGVAQNNTAYLGDLGDLSGIVGRATIDGVFRRLTATLVTPTGTANRIFLQLAFSVTSGLTVDFTFRIARPQLEWTVEPAAHLNVGTPYRPSGLLPAAAPRLDFDPVTLSPRGLLLERASSNFVLDSRMTAGVAFGTPGTLPTGMAASLVGVTGINWTLLRRGTERGMPFMDIRVFGAGATANGQWQLELIPGTTPAAAAANSTWTSSVYLALLSGRLPTAAPGHRVSTGARLGTALSTESAVGLGVFDALRTTPITHQRFQSTHTLAAGDNGVSSRILVNINNGEAVDFIIRIGAPQVEQSPIATSWIPTWGAAVTRGVESANLTGANFTSWYTAGPGTLVVKGSHNASTLAPSTIAFVAALNDGTSNNSFTQYINTNSSNVGLSGSSVVTGGVSQADFLISGATAQAAQGRAVTSGQAFATNNVTGSTRGVTSAPDTSATLPSGLNRLSLGSNGGDASGSVCLQFVDYYNTRVIDSDLAALTAT